MVRVLMFMYKEQDGHVQLQGHRSTSFRLTNGIREGAAASTILWAVYADGVLLVLRQSKLALVVADGASRNLNFSSCQEPKKCKSFCIFFVGPRPAHQVVYHAPLVLNGVELSWRESAVRLGHLLHQDLTRASDSGSGETS